MEPTKKRRTSFLKRKEPLVGKILAGKYRYLRVLGTGGMGEVHLVSDIDSGQYLAMKCCSEESSAERFEREVLSWMKVSKHPNLVVAMYFDRIDSVPTLFIEYVEGSNLKAVIEKSIKKKNDLPVKTVLDYAIQICRGMGHLHHHGIIHRDLKPSNIMIATEENGPGRIKITDMGLSKVKGVLEVDISTPTIETDFVLPDITNTRDMLGTPQYMSPQQYAYSKGVAEETDIYAFGIILYEMLTQGKRPFSAINSQGWFYAHTFKTPKHVKTQVSSRFNLFQRKSRNKLYDLVMQCLSKKISERPQSFKEIEKQLSELYQKFTNEKYGRDQYWKAGGMSYQELNNHAISLLEMGGDYVKEGWEKLCKLCDSNPDGLESRINKLLYELKKGHCTLNHFWYQGKKLLEERPDERVEIVCTIVGAAIEKGSYYTQATELLAEITERSSIIKRLDAKLSYLGGNYREAYRVFEDLCSGDSCSREDFYHWAGALVHSALKEQDARLYVEQNKFSVELKRADKQKTWYIMRKGEDLCGPGQFFEHGKDVAIGGLVRMKPFWHEAGVLFANKGTFRCIAISSDQTYALAGCDEKVFILDLARKESAHIFTEHKDTVTDVAIDWEGKYGISASADGCVYIWDLCGRQLTAFQHHAPVTQVAINSDKNLAVSSGTDGIIRVWNLGHMHKQNKLLKMFTKKQHCTFSPNRGEISAIAMGLDARLLLAGGEDGSVLLWDLESPRKSPTCLRGHTGPISRVAISADGKWAISSSNTEKDNLFIWDIAKKEKLLSFPAAKRGIFSMAVAGNAYWIFSASDDGIIHLWDLKYKKRKVATLEGHTGRIYGLAATFQGDLALSCGSDGTIRIWKNNYIWPPVRVQKYLKVVRG